MVKRDHGGDLACAARLSHPSSGRVLEVFTTEQYAQLYTGAFLDGALTGESAQRYEAFAGMCLECQGYPNGSMAPALGNIVVRAGETVRHKTVYAFSTTKVVQ